MALPPNLRVNTQLPFPSLVIGGGAITVAKLNGVWVISLAPQNLGIQTPAVSSFATDYVTVYDSIAKTLFQMPLANLLTGAAVVARLPAAAASVPILVTDIEVGISTSVAPTSCPLPSVVAWSALNVTGLELCIFDYTGNAATNNITPVLNGADTFTQGVVPVVDTNFGMVKLRPIVSGGGNSWLVRQIS